MILACHACHKKIAVAADLFGKSGQCPACGVAIQIPSADGETSTPADGGGRKEVGSSAKQRTRLGSAVEFVHQSRREPLKAVVLLQTLALVSLASWTFALLVRSKSAEEHRLLVLESQLEFMTSTLDSVESDVSETKDDVSEIKDHVDANAEVLEEIATKLKLR
ncbi:MAG: hypothetical protein AAB074_02200 [Planctomycetota bacterium]|mgnify:CR=1 FL=1